MEAHHPLLTDESSHRSEGRCRHLSDLPPALGLALGDNAIYYVPQQDLAAPVSLQELNNRFFPSLLGRKVFPASRSSARSLQGCLGRRIAGRSPCRHRLYEECHTLTTPPESQMHSYAGTKARLVVGAGFEPVTFRLPRGKPAERRQSARCFSS